MRSAGCIINDLIDINIDKKIERTSRRPLASNKLSLIEAFIMLIILLIPSFLILMQFSLKTILFGLASVPLIIIYPFTKRFTNWPQIFLGIVFNWGVLIVSIEFLGILKTDFILLYILQYIIKMLIIGHRGCDLYTENTMEAFQKAIYIGCDMIELDIQFTKDVYTQCVDGGASPLLCGPTAALYGGSVMLFGGSAYNSSTTVTP